MDPESLRLTALAPPPPPPQADLADLYREHRVGLVRLAVLLVGDLETAEDVVQDVFARLQGRRPPDLTLAYLRTCVLNGSRSVLRRRAVMLRRTQRVTDLADSAETAVLIGESRRQVLLALAELLKAVRVEDMPESFRIKVAPGADPLAVVRAVKDLPGVSNVIHEACGRDDLEQASAQCVHQGRGR
ncbi:sigma factor [Microbispora sp. ZYX-F-249]|uniref:Sigma factor n=1 Tax=Microbispora maris TaxID=3144104 RepID=A0ABV0ADT6_9ACTN